MRSSMRISALYLRAMRKNYMSWGAELTFFFRMREDPEHYWMAVHAVGEFEGRRVRTAAAGLLGHVTVSIPSLRLALMSDSLISSGIRMARRKRPKRSSWIGIVSLGARILFTDVSWGKASDCCVILYVGRLSPERTRCPFEICNEISFVFIYVYCILS